MSVPFRAAQLARWTKGELVQGNGQKLFTRVSIDSREIDPCTLFVAIRGPRHDAHSFLSDVFEAGAAGALVERGNPQASISGDQPLIEVDDTTAALGLLARHHRKSFEGTVVAITGSSGKTTTKELCASILEKIGPCLRTQGNLNNHYGLPLTLLRREPEDEFAVVEIGMNHPGEIAPLVDIADPSIAVITNVGSAHIEHMGSAEAIAEEKGALIESLRPEHVAVLNADDPLVMAQAKRTAAKVLRFGFDSSAEFRASVVKRVRDGFRFQLHTPGGGRLVQVPGASEVMIPNALAASAAAFAAGASLDHIQAGLASYQGIAGRMQMHSLSQGISIIDDSYNANPQSMSAALTSLQSLAKEGGQRAIAILGDMGELGEHAIEAHRALGKECAQGDLGQLIAFGIYSEELASAAETAGLRRECISKTEDVDDVIRRINNVLRPNDLILVKGSRNMKMERIVQALCAREAS
ncbi:MAG: UDP-N-acetylmuramoyl-tripeptide--D-alanyl-D-alanine ligase [Deltaproteobacteria bacterium]|nr:UDP-N-acetylmuramoyl-tripeptide--D-alanyl-D-alanine ligase [Deltaproteobacteria bacterium]